MNDPQTDPLEDELSLLAARADEEIAAGRARTGVTTMIAPPEHQPRLDKALACVELLRQFWNVEPPHQDADAAGPLPWKELGRFEIRAELGRGGFGVVYLAYDPRLQREVALKVPRFDFAADPRLRQRFQHEARAAAGLDHPNIVQVYETGEVGPVCYLASAYCPGVTLYAWMRARTEPVPIADAARLIATLAEAVQHAHERGLLHRDLKPSNILLQRVERREEKGEEAEEKSHHRTPPGSPSVALSTNYRLPTSDYRSPTSDLQTLLCDYIPKITDFGLAKHIAAESAESSVEETHHGAILGTPQYMAPEQAEARAGLISPATDVYALGAILYELLTSRPPFQADSVLELLVQVKSVEPLSPGKLRPRLSRDLETICLKCLEKDPRRRYVSAANLAADLRRYLAHEPILARPISLPERCVKWMRRHPAISGMGALTVLVALAGLSGILWQWRRAEEEATNARADRDIAIRAGAKSDENFRKAKEVVDQMTTVGRSLAAQPGMHKTAQDLLEKSLGFYKEFLAEKSADPIIRLDTARAYARVADIYKSLNKLEEAESALSEAILLLDGLLVQYPESELYLAEKAQNHLEQGDRLRSQKKLAQAEDSFNLAIRCWRELLQRSPANPLYKGLLATTLLNWCAMRRASPPEVEKALKESIQLEEEATAATAPNNAGFRFQLAMAYDDYGFFLLDRKDRTHAREQCERALAIRQALYDAQPRSMGRRQYLSRSFRNMARIYQEAGDQAKALASCRQAVQHAASLVAEYPAFPVYRSELTSLLVTQSGLLGAPAERPEKEALLRAIVEHYAKLASDVPSEPDYVFGEGTHQILLARLLKDMNRQSEAEDHFRAGLALRLKQTVQYPDNLRYQTSAFRDAIELRNWYQGDRRFKEVAGVLQQCWEAMPKSANANNSLAWFLATCEDASFHNPAAALASAKVANAGAPADANIWNTLGVVYYRLGEYRDAARALDEAMRLGKGGIPLDWLFRAMTFWKLGDKSKATEFYDRSVDWMNKNKSTDAELIRFRAEAGALLGKK